MLPAQRTRNKLWIAAEQISLHRRPLMWGFGLWVLVVALPFGMLYPGVALARPVAWILALLPPIGLLGAAVTADAYMLLGIGLAANVPVLVACPELLGSQAAGPVQGIALAVVGLLFVVAAFDHDAAQSGATHARLWRLWRPPASLAGRISAVLALVWLAMAWWPTDVAVERAESVRVARVAAVAVVWVAVRRLPLARVAVDDRPGVAATVLLKWLTFAVLIGIGLWWLRAPQAGIGR